MNKWMKTGISLIAIMGCLIGGMPSAFAQPSSWAYDAAYWARTEGAFPQDMLTHNMNTTQLTREDLAEILVYAYAEAMNTGVDALPAGEPFTDTENPMVGKAYQAGLMTGTTDISFSPNSIVSRASLVGSVKTFLEKMGVSVVSNTSAPFADYSIINQSQRPTVDYLYGVGILSGYAEDQLQPSLPATVEVGMTMMMRVLKSHNWMSVPDLELEAERTLKNGFTVPVRTSTELTIYQPSSVDGIRMYYTGLGSGGVQSGTDKAHRQLIAIAERYYGYNYQAVYALTDVLEEAWDGAKKTYSIETPIYINGATGAVSSEPLFTSKYIKVSSGNRLMVDFIK